MWTKQLQNISFISFLLLIFTNCNTPLKDTVREFESLPDTLSAKISLAHKYGKIPPQKPLTDSVTNLYISLAHEGTRYTYLDSLDTYYKAYSEGRYQLNEDAYGEIVRFEPEGNAYYSLQLYIFNKKGTLLDALELAYLFGEEGANGEGSSYLIREKDKTKVFSKQYWITYFGEDANLMEELDTVIVYEIKEGKKIPTSIDPKTEKEIQNLFTK